MQNEIRLHSSTRTGKKKWTKEAMKNALEAVSNKEMMLRQASTEFNIPKSTLHDHISGCVHPGAVYGAPRYLDDEEEDEVVRSVCSDWLYKEYKGG